MAAICSTRRKWNGSGGSIRASAAEPASSALEAIADVADRLDVARTPRISFDFRAKRRHASIHAPIIDRDGVAPHAIENLVAGQRAAGALRKEFHEPELFRRKRDLLSVSEEFVRCEIQFAVSK